MNNNPRPRVDAVDGDDHSENEEDLAIQAAANSVELPLTMDVNSSGMHLADGLTDDSVENLLAEADVWLEAAQFLPRQPLGPLEHLHSDQIALYNDGVNFRRRFNCCAEHSLSALAVLLQSSVDFDLGIYGLMNLATSLMDGFPPELVTCIGAQGAPDFGAWLTSLDNTQHYLLRRGTQSGTGHHSVLTHVNGDWHVIDTSSMTPIALTRNGQLLMENCRRLFTPDRGMNWGRGFREYSILCAPVNAAILPELNRHLRLQRLEQYENQLLYNHQRRNQIPPSEEPLRPSPFERLHSDQIALYNDGINFRRRFNCSAEYCLSALAFLLQTQVHFDLAHYGQINLPAN
ncbi:MAG: hypothetical protein ACRC9R_03140, partial [Enterovibrio sp.]